MSITGEARSMAASGEPITLELLTRHLRDLGLKPGMDVLLHSSLSSLGWVVGGPVTVIEAFLAVLTPDGTLMMPAHSSDNSDPADWSQPPVPEAWWPIIRETMPAYDPALTPTRGMGRIAELFRTWPGALRSAHPALSFAAKGRAAAFLTADHVLAHALGETSPLARLYDRDGWVCLLGVGHDSNTSLHLAEYRAQWPDKRTIRQGAAMRIDDIRQWAWYDDIEYNVDIFPAIGEAFETHSLDQPDALLRGQVGAASVRLIRQRPLVDFAVGWLEAHHRR